MTLHHVSRSDEGLYKCRVQNRESPESRLSVSGKPTTTMDPPTASSPPPASSLHLVLRVICHLVVFCPYCISTFLMVSIYRERATGAGFDFILSYFMWISDPAESCLPLMEGDNVTLTCRTKMADPPSADFYKDGVSIRNVSDEGLYKCRVQNRESPESRLSVSEKPTTTMDPPTASSPPPASSLHLMFRVICHLVVFCPYCISSFLMVSIYRERATGSDLSVSMAMNPSTHAEQGLDDDYDDDLRTETESSEETTGPPLMLENS
ncbi:hypothetical protein F7725_016219 [Dissostichus mawsoni]|uniref:Ig-like domain-containing protein n=1 Tax=Dissostichus mawsoni TaxID=36200 RepID=A0A7J5Z1H6_DISMA|nr:hypothetical protein F7725_016219 [Dissostichus mawsoni]